MCCSDRADKSKYFVVVSPQTSRIGARSYPIEVSVAIVKHYEPSSHAASAEGSQAADAGALDDRATVQKLRTLCTAYAANDLTASKRLEPEATKIGQMLHARGGLVEMRRIFQELHGCPGSRTLEMHWDGIGEWRG
jgi:hypothetical protein